MRSTLVRQTVGIARADLRERVRGRAVIVALIVSVVLGHLVTAGDLQLALGGYRGIENAAWLGTNMALASSGAVAVVGFILVKDAVARDRDGGPAKLIAASPAGTPTYLAGKWLSNLVVLLGLVVATAVAVAVLFVLRGTGSLDPVALFLPFVVLTVPVAAVVASVALAFETVGPLSGSIGNVLYIGALFGLLITSVADPIGAGYVVDSMESVLNDQHSAYSGDGLVFGATETEGQFEWAGLSVTDPLLVHRLQYLGVALLVLAAATIPFDRFDPATASLSPERESSSDAGAADVPAGGEEDVVENPDETVATTSTTLPSLEREANDGLAWIPVLVTAELRLAIRGRRRSWYFGALGILIAGAVAGSTTRPLVLAAAWIWPLFIWSAAGVREYRHRMTPLVLSSRRPKAQLLATWAATVVVTGVLVAPAAIRAGFAVGALAVVAIGVGTLFVPAIAVATGVVTRTSRAFEVAYLLLWYVGIANATPALDYGGVTAPDTARIVGFALVVPVALGVALAVRHRRAR